MAFSLLRNEVCDCKVIIYFQLNNSTEFFKYVQHRIDKTLAGADVFVLRVSEDDGHIYRHTEAISGDSPVSYSRNGLSYREDQVPLLLHRECDGGIAYGSACRTA